MAKKTKKAEGEAKPAPTLFDRTLRLIALGGIYGALLVPVVVVQDSIAYPFIFLKSLFLQAILALTVPAYLILVWRQPALRLRRSWLSIALGVYFVALSLSCAFAFNRHHAFWGSEERMAGLFSLAHFFVWYVMAASLLRTWPDWRRILHWQAALGFYAALAALVDLGDPRIDRISGPFGNPIYSATYHMFVIGILALLWVRARSSVLRALYALGAAASLATLVFAGSRGTLLGSFFGLIVGALVWTITGRRWRYLIAAAGCLLLAGAGYVSVLLAAPSLTHHPKLQHLFIIQSDPIRPSLWSIALAGFRDHPLLGWGLGHFEAVFDTHYLPHTYCNDLLVTVPDIAHSFLFEHLSTTGAFGTLAFGAIWAAFALSLWRAFRQGWIEDRALGVLLGLAAAYLLQGLFITDSPSSYSMLFLLLALAGAAGFPEFACKSAPTVEPMAARPVGRAPWALLTLQAGGVLLAWLGSVQPALASHTNLQSGAAFRRGGCGAMLENARRAAAMTTPWSEDQLREIASALRDLADQGGLQRCPQWRELYDLAREKAVAASGGRPEHFRYRVTLAGLTVILGLKFHDTELLNEAERLYEALIADSPQRQQYRIQYATLLAQTGRVEAGDAQLVQAAAVAPEVGEALWKLGVYRWQYEKQAPMGSRMMIQAVDATCRHYLTNWGDAGMLAQAFSVQGDLAGLRAMERRMRETLGEAPQPAVAYLDIARYQEKAGLFAERDRMLRMAAAQDSAVGARLAPLFDGRVKTIAEAEQLAPPAKTNP